ncbi:hypothetical protein B7486_61420 [cyanobacterium TDX16]|nr:hypothetical protein B7486_61420 [cyanobacterium TDX16]
MDRPESKTGLANRILQGLLQPADGVTMEELLIVVLVLGTLFLAFSAYLLITNRRSAEPPFVAELPVPPEVRAAVYGAKERETQRQTEDEGTPRSGGPPTGPAGPAVDTLDADDAQAPPAATSSAGSSHVPLVDALSGMDLPCDLTYLGTVEPDADVHEVLAFLTDQHTPDEVEQAFHAELRRLGYELQPGGQERGVLATRGEMTFAATVHHPAGAVMRGKTKAFPTAPPTSVVVELSRR